MSYKGKKLFWIMKKGGLKSMLHHSNSRHQRVNFDRAVEGSILTAGKKSENLNVIMRAIN